MPDASSRVFGCPSEEDTTMARAVRAWGAVLAASALLLSTTAVASTARPGTHKPPGQLAYGRYEPTVDDLLIHVARPDGTGDHVLLPTPLECPHWAPDGRRIATCGSSTGGATTIIDARSGSYQDLPMPDPSLFTTCYVWSPDARRLACEGASDSQPERNGVYTVRTRDAQNLRLLASAPGQDVVPGSFSPDGTQLVYSAGDADGNVTLNLVTTATRLTSPITSAGDEVSSAGDFAPQSNWIAFSRHLTSDNRSSLWLVRPDGHGLHELNVLGTTCGGRFDDPASVGCSDPHWSPDGKHLVFVLATADTGRNLAVVGSDGSGLQRVTSDGQDEMPDWGPDPDNYH
jgi:Tol biopolymer transport system component